MPQRRELLVNGEYYHVYNRSSFNQDIFVNDREIRRFLDLMEYYQIPRNLRYSKFNLLSEEGKIKLIKDTNKDRAYISLFAYALMPDHYHFLVRQEIDNGIRKFISNLQNAFAKYYNLKNKNRGSLFVNSFKAKRIPSEEVFKHVSRYIHLNPVSSYLIEIGELGDFINTSFPYYLNGVSDRFINTQYLLGMFGGIDKYREFVENRADYQRKLKKINKFILEENI